MNRAKLFFVSCFGINTIIGFIGFGYLSYKVISYWSIIPICLFVFFVVLGINYHEKDIIENYTKKKPFNHDAGIFNQHFESADD